MLRNDDLRRLALGLPIACATGLLLGGALQPTLDEREAAGPQILMGESGPRRMLAADDAGVARYAGRLPDYVVGTDATRPAYEPAVHAEDAALDHDGEPRGDVMAYEDPSPVTMASYVEPPREEPVYPSMRGNTHYEGDLPAPPPPPADLDSEAVISG
ncbi:MAG: hypothetical protein JNK30_19635 [Phenylobacterium sp.]|uniref:hypothetical protein n=1 Tax=Phenylobacterium sp. TaxID=1871053 RepID=UPI001A48682B|nr:hypothetical protein [Phenylobacterium sp.]MBL8773607.1 hypothetical protein [Phenylobacterium sp.]